MMRDGSSATLACDTTPDARFWAGPLRSSPLTSAGEVTSEQLESMVEARAEAVGADRLVLLHGGNDVEFVVSLLACLRVGSPVIVAGSPTASRRLVEQFDPDVVIDEAGGSLA